METEFKINDWVTHPQLSNKVQILSFEVTKDNILVKFTNHQSVILDRKLTKIEVLFQTEDGIDIFIDEEVIVVDPTDWSIDFFKFRDQREYKNTVDYYKYFSALAMEKAKDYILMNKPCLSLNDIKLEIGTRYLETLKELVKTKL